MLSDEEQIAGYYTLGASTIPLNQVPNKYTRGVPQFSFPAILIGQFGVDMSWQG